MSITVIVARELGTVEEIAEIEGPHWKAVVIPGDRLLTENTAKVARTVAFGQMVSAIVAHGWGDAFFVPGARNRRGVPRRKWSAERTRALFGKA